MIWVELDGGVCYELGDDSFLLVDTVSVHSFLASHYGMFVRKAYFPSHVP